MPATLDANPAAAPSELGPATSNVPDADGRFGPFGKRFVPETLMQALDQLTAEYALAKQDESFQAEVDALLADFVGRETPLYFAERLTEHCGGAKIFFKREDLCHTGAHKINNTIGQALLAKRMGKRRIIAETGAGQHGVATATACARFGLECIVYMGEEDIRRQALNVFKMKAMGTTVQPVSSGSRTLRDAVNEAMREWMASVETTHYIIGSAIGPHPFPMLVRDFQAVIGREARRQCLDTLGSLPSMVVACVGGGSNAAGMFHPFIDDQSVRIVGVEAGGRSNADGDHASPLSYGSPGVLHGSYSYVLQNGDGQTLDVHSVSAGLDYPGVGPEHSYWKESGRVEYTTCDDDAALDAFFACSRQEGIIPAVETAHAVDYAMKAARTMSADESIVVCLSGRGDKDIDEVDRVMRMRGESL